jgi:hypothetical protein
VIFCVVSKQQKQGSQDKVFIAINRSERVEFKNPMCPLCPADRGTTYRYPTYGEIRLRILLSLFSLAVAPSSSLRLETVPSS